MGNKFRRTRWAHQPKKVDEGVVEKIKKLLALHESTTSEGEAQNALKQAQRLMMEHKISEGDLYTKDKGREVIYITLTEGKRVERWRSYLATILAENFGCVGYYNRYRHGVTKIMAFGLEDDIEILRYAYTYTVEVAENLLRMYVAETGKSGANVRKSFLVGFTIGLKEALEEQRAEHQEWALVLQKPEEVQKEADELGLRPRKENTGIRDRNAMAQGVHHGRQHDPTRRRIASS